MIRGSLANGGSTRDISTEWPTPHLLERPMLPPRGSDLTVAAAYDSVAPADRALLVVSRYNARALQAAPTLSGGARPTRR